MGHAARLALRRGRGWLDGLALASDAATLKDKAAEQVGHAKEAVADAASKAKEKGSELADAAKDKAGDLAAKGQAAIADAKDRSGEAIDDATDAVGTESDELAGAPATPEGEVTAVDAAPDSDAITADAVEGGTINGTSTKSSPRGSAKAKLAAGERRQHELTTQVGAGPHGPARTAAHREGPGCHGHPGPSLLELARTDRGTVRASTCRRAGRGSCGPNPSLPPV